jgi:uncharacterized membrane protein
MNLKNSKTNLLFEFLGVLLVAIGIFYFKFYSTTFRDTGISVGTIIIGAFFIIYGNIKKRKRTY